MDTTQYIHMLQAHSSLNQNEYIVDTTQEMLINNDIDIYVALINTISTTYYPLFSELYHFMTV